MKFIDNKVICNELIIIVNNKDYGIKFGSLILLLKIFFINNNASHLPMKGNANLIVVSLNLFHFHEYSRTLNM